MTKKFTKLFSAVLLAVALLASCIAPAYAANNTTALDEVLEFIRTEPSETFNNPNPGAANRPGNPDPNASNIRPQPDETLPNNVTNETHPQPETSPNNSDIEARPHNSVSVHDLTANEELDITEPVDLVPHHKYEIRTYFNNSTNQDWERTYLYVTHELPNGVDLDHDYKYELFFSFMPSIPDSDIIVRASIEDIRIDNEQYILHSNTDVDGTILYKTAYQPICTNAETLTKATHYSDGCIEAHTYGYLSYTFTAERAHPSTEADVFSGPSKDPDQILDPNANSSIDEELPITPVPAKGIRTTSHDSKSADFPLSTKDHTESDMLWNAFSHCLRVAIILFSTLYLLPRLILHLEGGSNRQTLTSPNQEEIGNEVEQMLNQASSVQGDLPVDGIHFPNASEFSAYPDVNGIRPNNDEIYLTLDPENGPPEGYPVINLAEIETNSGHSEVYHTIDFRDPENIRKTNVHVLRACAEHIKKRYDPNFQHVHILDENGVCIICGSMLHPSTPTNDTPAPEKESPKPVNSPKKIKVHDKKSTKKSKQDSSKGKKHKKGSSGGKKSKKDSSKDKGSKSIHIEADNMQSLTDQLRGLEDGVGDLRHVKLTLEASFDSTNEDDK